MQLNTVQTTDRVIQIEIEGRLDAVGVETIDAEFTSIVQTLDHHLIIDLAKTPYVSSIGVAMFVAAEHGLRKRGLKIVLAGATPEVAKLLVSLKIDKLVPICDTVEDAFQELAESED